MSYEILRTGENLSLIHITEASFNSFEGWRVEFHDGKEAMLYNCNDEWIQYGKLWLDRITLLAIGNCIVNRMVKKNSGITDSYFYEMLIN